ncbi:MAG: metallophosphoesterase [Clostridia bacterium]|nr:metallophosphoesterase [Clostridia bacterium]
MKKSLFAKALSVSLSLTMLLGVFQLFFTVHAQSDTVRFAVGTDIHIDNTQTALDVNYPENELYFQASGSGNIYDQAAALTKDFLHKSVENGAQFILITGDLTRNGTGEQHRFTASLLADFEKESGIPVYVVPGNHDYFNSSRDDFRKYYAALGYDTALANDEKTASYTADIGGNYRLIAVDSNDPGNDGDGIDSSLLDWIKSQALRAHKDGKEIIYMMHHPLLEHLYLGHLLMKDFLIKNSETVAEQFTQWGIKYVFTGHEHGNDVAAYTGKNGEQVYDVLTTALSSYPLEYRSVVMSSEGADLKMQKIDRCNTDELVSGYTDAQKALLESDFEEFALGLFRYSVEKKILRYTSSDFIKGKLKVTGGPLAVAVDNLFNAVNDALVMPLYDSGDGVSIEKLAASKGVSLPQSDYGSLIELASAVVAVHYYGDENIPSDSNPECEILVKGLNTGLQYILTRTGRSGLNLLLGIIGTKIGTDELSPLFNAVSLGKEDSYKVAGEVLYPLLDRFTVDFSLPDRDVFLPSQADGAVSDAENPAGFLDSITAFFRKILSMFTDIFKVLLPV